MNKNYLYIIGVSSDNLPEHASHILANCRCIFSTDRFSKITDHLPQPVYPITPLSSALKQMEEELLSGDIAVMASGDPLFFGIGKKLISHFGSDLVQIMPAISSMQQAFARIKQPWQDAFFISRHGRQDRLSFDLLDHEKIFIFTDSINTPAVIAAEILDLLSKAGVVMPELYFKCFVAENLGFNDERVVSGTLSDISEMSFAKLNVMILLRESMDISLANEFQFGLKEEDIKHSRGLITKDEIRAVCLHKLKLPKSGVFWDIGAGSGSISIEAARLSPGLKIFSIERKPEEQANIISNIDKYNLTNVELIKGEAPLMLSDLPCPDRVFIGGSGGNLQEIIKAASSKISKNGILVVTAVTDITKENAPLFMYENGFKVELSEINVRRSSFPTRKNAINLNPITIITGKK